MNALILPINPANAATTPFSPPTIDFFYSSTCPHCKAELSFLGQMQDKYVELRINKYNVYEPNTVNTLKIFFNKYKVPDSKQGQVPITFIGQKYFIGFDETVSNDLEHEIKKRIKQENDQSDNTIRTTTGTIRLPLLGEIKLSDHSPLFLSIAIGTLDGFNACAMTALGFLLAVLIASKMRKKVLIVGGTFIFVSGLVYFLFISAWLNLLLFLNQARWITLAIGATTIVFGVFMLKDYISGIVCKICHIDPKSKNPLNNWQKKLFTRLSYLTSAQMPLILMLLGVSIVAAGINTIELFCSFGFPLAFTNYLTTLGLSTSSYYLYLIIYVIFYMIDDFIIFLIALFTLRVTKMSDKYLRFIMLISGVALLLLGVYMLWQGF